MGLQVWRILEIGHIKKRVVKMKNILKNVIDTILYYIQKFLFIFIKKDRKICIFGDFGGKRFGDNCKYLYLYLYQNPNYFNKIIWITRSREVIKKLQKNGYEVYYMYSLKSIYYHLKAKYHFIDQGEMDIFGFLSRGAIKINLWHGLPLKKIMALCADFEKKYIGSWDEQFLLTCSQFGSSTLGKAFRVSTKKMLLGLYPRVDRLISNSYPLFDDERSLIAYIDSIKSKGKKILLYLPTFRDKHKLKFLGINNKKELEKIFKFLEENDYFLISKIHLAGLAIDKENNEQKLKNTSFFLNLSAEFDIYAILKEIDILITDYSSIYYDFLVLDKDIIFYPYDLKIYSDVDRGLLFDYDKITPGDKVYNIDELIENLKLKINTRDSFEKERRKLYNICFENYTMYDTITSILNLEGNKDER